MADDDTPPFFPLPPVNPQTALSSKEIASLFDVPHSAVLAWIRCGQLPATRTGGKWLIARETFHRLLRAGGAGLHL